MRYVVLLACVIGLFLAAPRTEVSLLPASPSIFEVSVLPEAGRLSAVEPLTAIIPIQSMNPVGTDSLVFAVAPKLGTMPVMPDISPPLPDGAPDGPPIVAAQPPRRSGADGEADVARITPEASKRKVTANSLYLRAGPSTRTSVAAYLERGDTLIVLGNRQRGWIPVRDITSGRRGWVFHRFTGPS